MPIKPIEFLGDSLRSLREFPDDAKRDAGYQLDRVQHGLQPDDFKPMPTIGVPKNSATMAPISARVELIFSALKMKGSAAT